MSYNLSQIMKSAHRNYKKGGKTFSECLKSAWSFENSKKVSHRKL